VAFGNCLAEESERHSRHEILQRLKEPGSSTDRRNIIVLVDEDAPNDRNSLFVARICASPFQCGNFFRLTGTYSISDADRNTFKLLAATPRPRGLGPEVRYFVRTLHPRRLIDPIHVATAWSNFHIDKQPSTMRSRRWAVRSDVTDDERELLRTRAAHARTISHNPDLCSCGYAPDSSIHYYLPKSRPPGPQFIWLWPTTSMICARAYLRRDLRALPQHATEQAKRAVCDDYIIRPI